MGVFFMKSAKDIFLEKNFTISTGLMKYRTIYNKNNPCQLILTGVFNAIHNTRYEVVTDL